MALLTILVSIIIERYLGSLEALRRYDWFVEFERGLRHRFPVRRYWQAALGVVVAVGLPVLLTAVVFGLLDGLWSVLGFAFAVFVLLYSLGPRDMEAEVEAYLEAGERGDAESAGWHAGEFLGEAVPLEPQTLTRRMMETVLTEAHRRFFGVLFWFLLLGPAGALLFRLACVLRSEVGDEESELGDAARRLHATLAWVPVRLAALGYALSGSFVEAMHGWKYEASTWQDINEGVLVTTGLGALRYDLTEEGESSDRRIEHANIRETLALVRRTVLVWLAVLALFTLSGWMG